MSYFAARPSRDLMVAGHQEATRELWPKLCSDYDAYVSALVYQEAAKGDGEQAKARLATIGPFGMRKVAYLGSTLRMLFTVRCTPWS